MLGRGGYWKRQREVCDSVVRYRTTLVPAGNSVGKSYVAAGLLHWFLIEHPNCLVVATAPTQVQLEEVLWKEVERAYRGSRIPLGGRLLRSPLKVDMGGGWHALAYSTTKTERFSGHHAKDLFAILDESSGVEPAIWEAFDSLNPSRMLCLGNPLRPDGAFYERCMRAEERQDDLGRLANLIRIPSTESPDIHLTRSPRGMADATWLEAARNDYGEGSLWWLPHVEALFPDSAVDTLIPRAWLDRAEKAKHEPRGPCRLAIDIAEGRGGDRSVLLCRDDNGTLDLEFSRSWSFAQLASRAADMAKRNGVEGHRIAYDATGVGADFNARLEGHGIKGARAYRGGSSGGHKFANLRSAAAWAMRQRFDPNRLVPVAAPDGRSGMLPQAPFAVRPEHMTQLRRELQALKYQCDNDRQVALEDAEELAKALGHSPDLASALIISWAFPG